MSKKQAIVDAKKRQEDGFKVSSDSRNLGANSDPFGGFNNVFSTTQNRNQEFVPGTLNAYREEFSGFNAPNTSNLDGDVFSNFENEFGTQKKLDRSKTSWDGVSDANNDTFSLNQTVTQRSVGESMFITRNDSLNLTQKAPVTAPKNEPEIDLLNDFATIVSTAVLFLHISLLSLQKKWNQCLSKSILQQLLGRSSI